MTAPKTGKRTDAELWKAIQDMEVNDEMDRIAALSKEELDAEIRADGGDPDAIGARGAAFVKELLEQQERVRWQAEARAKADAFRQTAEDARTKVKLPRAEILKRLTAARNDPRFAAPVAMLFQKKTEEASTDEELQALLEQIDLLGKLEES